MSFEVCKISFPTPMNKTRTTFDFNTRQDYKFTSRGFILTFKHIHTIEKKKQITNPTKKTQINITTVQVTKQKNKTKQNKTKQSKSSNANIIDLQAIHHSI